MVTGINFGVTKAGELVKKYALINGSGMGVSVLDYGCTVAEIRVPDKNNNPVDVCLGYDTIAEYETNDGFLGAVVGRHANRIQNGRFELNGKVYSLAVNDGPNHLHGGVRGFDKYVWDSEISGDSVIFTRLSPDGEEGYPGNLQLKVTYSLTDDNTLDITYEAKSDADTVVNLTNHTYFNLGGHKSGTILDQELQLFADRFTENDAHCLPTGKISPVAGTPFDFTQPKRIGKEIAEQDIQLENGNGYDHNFVLSDKSDFKKAARLYSPVSGIAMAVFTTMPGVQVYTSNGLTERNGKRGARYAPHDAVCLETQYFPNAMACRNFPSPVLKQGELYRHTTEYHFEVK